MQDTGSLGLVHWDDPMGWYGDITGPVVEIWVTSGEEAFTTTPPEGCEPFDYEASETERLGAYDAEGALKLNVHYYAFANQSCFRLHTLKIPHGILRQNHPLLPVDIRHPDFLQ